MTHPTPGSAEEVTLDWLNDVLFAEGDLEGAVATDFEISIIGDGVGFLGDLCRLVPFYNSAADKYPSSMVLKFPTENETGRNTGRNLSAYQREVQFYANCANNAPWCNPPRHYYSASIGHEDDYLLVMEDLQDHRFVEQTGGIDREDASNILIALARFHAHYWESDELNDMTWLKPLSEFAEIYPGEIKTGWPRMKQNYRYAIEDQYFDLFPEGNDLYPALVRELQKRPTTLLHGDFRMENVAFSTEPGPEAVRVYDWQLCNYGPAAYDVMYFFGMSVNVADWESMGQELIDIYYNALTEAGVTNYPMSTFRQDMSLAACMMFGFISIVGNIVPPDEAGHAVISSTLPRFFNIMSVLDVRSTLADFK